MLDDLLLVAKITRGLSLSGQFYAQGTDLVLEDNDKNPTVRISRHNKSVKIVHQGDIREIILLGVKQIALDAGYTYSESLTEKELPPELQKLKELLTSNDSSRPKKVEVIN